MIKQVKCFPMYRVPRVIINTISCSKSYLTGNLNTAFCTYIYQYILLYITLCIYHLHLMKLIKSIHIYSPYRLQVSFFHSCRLKFTLPCYIFKNYVSTFPDWPDFFSFPHVSDFNFKFGTRFYFSYFNIRLSYLGCFCQKDVMFLLYKYGTH